MVKYSISLAEAFKLALKHHQAGEFLQAEEIYQWILSNDPENAEANHLLGVLAYQKGKHELAVHLIAKAIMKDSGNASYLNNLGLALEALGKLDEAVTAYREAFAIKPDYIDAYNNLGHVLQAQGRLDEALTAYQQVLAIKPDYAEVHNNRGVILQSQGRFEEALAAYQQSLAIKPGYAEAHNNRGNILQALGRLEEALAAYEQAIAIKPDYAGAHNNRGHVLQIQGRHDQALASYQQAIAIKPDYAEAYINRGNLFLEQGSHEDALAAYQHAIAINPEHAGAHNNLGSALITQGRFDEALTEFQRAIELNPGFADAFNNLGNVLETRCLFEEALTAYEQALAINPRHADAHNNRGIVFQALGRHGEALESYQQAIAIEPGFADAHNNRGNALQAQGRLDEAVAAYRHVLTLRPGDARIYSNLLLCLNYQADVDGRKLFAAHREYDTRFAAGLIEGTLSHPHTKDTDRRLRIGYVSPDFYRHPVASFIEPLLAAHNHRAFEVICYANVTAPDAVTERLQKLADKWHNIAGLSDEQVAELVREDTIDILVDLAGHTGGNRLLVFARKPAPVQVTYLGYPSSSGLSAMDYRLSDDWIDPPGMTEAFHSEELVRLPGGSLCFQPQLSGPGVSPLPDLSPGNVTFGSFNNAVKVVPEVVAQWSQLLQALPGSRLLMKGKQLGDRETIERYQNMFERQGVAPERLEFVGWIPSSEEHLALYNRVHIALDTFPYNGCTTTCEALWMGIPVITLAGNDSRSRVGVSILKQAGLEDCIADSPEAYIEIAKDLANNINKLQQVRAGLREKMQQSPLLDAAAFTHKLESAYRDMWNRWCNT